MALNWYFRTVGADPNDPASYTIVGGTPPTCVGTVTICSILTNDDGFGEPILDDPLKSQMVTALQNHTNQSRVLLRSTS